ncbi:uncharacterized protein LACBIDRAFT_306822 [Laccaria bicolor S238N-H82]|uniref:Predicted protein n=1 Tax=Laccaria bicolor (strain S238N-H82 / ATCC MYA-4686) TaxID=486041 RepID=B0DNT3_LACBS|nr:uncharacterized protein LACBIDRAFT_306822 [Laccaria bicolor S238N-H82]EDR03779.1 predicted protein [Laccaria bicolor S238N-H82]|eukprot:XP_001885632.1 predicted protein [Laccaria bicolor S238N-H82]
MTKRTKASRKTLRAQTVTAQASAIDDAQLTSSDHASHPVPPRTPPRNSRPGSVQSESVEDTPMSHSSHGADRGFATVEAAVDFLHEELSENYRLQSGPDFGVTLPNGVDDERLDDFLAKSRFYTKQKRWKGIPKKPSCEKKLYQPFLELICGILSYFQFTTRQAHDTHARKLTHVEGVSNTALKSSPDIFISGTGDAFCPVSKLRNSSKLSSKPSYRACASPLEIKTDKNYTFDSNLIQIAVYARQCFIQQENRFFVYSAILTETFIQLFQFDRAGVMFSGKINIHIHPRSFVHIILTLASQDPVALGFDKSIHWRNSKRYLSMDVENELVEFEIKKLKASFLRRAIRGRGTCCWNVVNPKTKEEYLAKDCWRSANRTPEWELLEKAKGLDGVGQMIGYWEPGFSVGRLRGIGRDTPGFRDRDFCRVLLERYGKPIHQFDDRKKLLYALRDAISGHQNLWNAEILHRDVSINNILMGKKDAPVGNRGVIIDLDMAILLNREGSLAGVDFRTGTRAFQSMMVLRSQTNKPGVIFPAHDYLDDLESFFYVFCYICFAYEAPGKKKSPQPTLLTEWEDFNSNTARHSKLSFLTESSDHDLSPWFGEGVFQTLLQQMGQFVYDHYMTKDRRLKQPRRCLNDLTEAAHEQYAIFLGYVDEAIEKLEAMQPEVAPDGTILASGVPPITPPRSSPSSSKRPSNDVLEGSPSSKKPKRNPHAPRFPSTLSMETGTIDDSLHKLA